MSLNKEYEGVGGGVMVAIFAKRQTNRNRIQWHRAQKKKQKIYLLRDN